MIFNIGDKVIFSSPNYLIFDKEGENVYQHLKEGNTYTVSIVGILCLRLLEVEGVYLPLLS